MAPSEDFIFNLQTFLRDMRLEQQRDHESLSNKVDEVLEMVHSHDTRITVVENTRKSMLWLGSALIVAVLGFIADMVVNHIPQVFAAVPLMR